MSNNSNEHLYFDDETGEFVVRKYVIADSSSKTSNRGTSQANIVPSRRVYDSHNTKAPIDTQTKLCIQPGKLAGDGSYNKTNTSIDTSSRMSNRPVIHTSSYIKQSKKEDTIGSKIWNVFKKILEWLE